MNTKQDAQEKMLLFLITATGGDITAPNTVIQEQMKSFQSIHSIEDDDEVTDAMIALSRCFSQQEKLEAIAILAMRFLTMTNIIKLTSFLRDYGKSMLDYIQEHPEARESNPEDKAMNMLGGMFGLNS